MPKRNFAADDASRNRVRVNIVMDPSVKDAAADAAELAGESLSMWLENLARREIDRRPKKPPCAPR